jgi:hypothetical protein
LQLSIVGSAAFGNLLDVPLSCPHQSAKIYLRPPLQNLWRLGELGKALVPFALVFFFLGHILFSFLAYSLWKTLQVWIERSGLGRTSWVRKPKNLTEMLYRLSCKKPSTGLVDEKSPHNWRTWANKAGPAMFEIDEPPAAKTLSEDHTPTPYQSRKMLTLRAGICYNRK